MIDQKNNPCSVIEAVIAAGLDPLNTLCGDVSDVDPKTHGTSIYLISVGRAEANDAFGNIDDLLDKFTDESVLWYFSISRSKNHGGANIDFLIPLGEAAIKKLPLHYISLGLGNDSSWGDISKLHYLDKLDHYTAEYISLGLGDNDAYKDISELPFIWELAINSIKELSMGKSV